MNKSERTKNALAKSLRKLIKKEPLGRITVTAIAENCNMNRQTFYYHFHDVYELIGWIYSQEIEKIFGEDASYEQWRESLLELFTFIQKNKDFVSKTIRAVDNDYALKYILGTARSIVEAVLEKDEQAKELSKTDRKLIVDFYAAGLVGTILTWIDGGVKEEPASLTNRIEKLLSSDVPQAVLNLTKEG